MLISLKESSHGPGLILMTLQVLLAFFYSGSLFELGFYLNSVDVTCIRCDKYILT